MNASLARNGKGKAAMSGALLTAFPASGIARITEIHPGLVSLPGSQSVLEPPVAASLVAAPPFRTGEPCRRALSPTFGRGGTFLSLTSRNELGGNSARHCAQGHPGFGSLHGPTMRESHAERVASAYAEARS